MERLRGRSTAAWTVTVTGTAVLPGVFFVPWSTASVDQAAETAIRLRRERGLEGMVVANEKALVPGPLSGWPHRTLRTRTPIPPRSVLAVVRPSYELLAGLRVPSDCVVVVAEDAGEPLHGWAQFVGALDVTTGAVLGFDVSDEVEEGFVRLFDTTHGGLLDERSVRRAREAVAQLHLLGLSGAQIIGYPLSGRRPAGARGYHGQRPFNTRAIRRLRTLLP